MAKITIIFAQLLAASCLLASVTSFPTDDAEAVTEKLEAWLDSLYKMYQTVAPDNSQEQELQQPQTQEQQFPQQQSQEQQLVQNSTQEPPEDSQQQSQEQQLEQHYTQEKVNYIKDLFAKLKPENFNKELIQKLKEHLENDSEEDEPEQTETQDSKDDSDEETTTTTEGTTPTTTTTTTTTTTEAPKPICFGYKPDVDISYYLQFDGVYWLKMPCPHGFGFDYNACACSVKLDTPRPKPTTTTEATTTTTTEATTTTTPEETTTTTPEETTTTTPEATTTTTPEATTTTTPEATTTTPAITPEATTTTTTTTTVKPSLELCNDCVILHGVGYAPFPGYCDAFIQCRFYGDVPTAVSIRKCPSGKYWNQDKLTCDFEENVKCTPVNNCPNHKAINGDWGAYLIFNGETWARVPCPPSTTYNSITCGCTDKHDNDDDDNSNEICSDKRAISGDKTGYLQITGNGWVRMPCPATVGYNEQTCGCTDKLDTVDSSRRCPDKKFIKDDKTGYLQFNGVSWIRQPCPATLVYNPDSCICTYDVEDNDDSKSKDDDLCKSTVALTFDNNDATDSSVNEFWVNNTGVTFNDGKAYFNGKSRLTIPGLSNMEFGSTVYIYIKYRHSSASSDQTLVANGDCQVRQSLAICSGKESVNFYAETKEQLTLAKVTVPRDTGLWQNVVYALDKDSLEGSVGTNKVSQPIKGALDRRQRGLVIGGGGDCDNFHGIIDDIQVFLC